ncbi:hypothetical protein [Methylobacterium sp. E-046]|uniref:hypothetical protein n=1 Tax=Methylobacterium sp. E-046 TaxID=2836576 RepID=UPI001FBAC23C|nr:hypothetical protein [Methylobacterium sp. E-046]MCJ2102385.1 hypothetical protein [Methylobacterium sp. E-046]
MTETDKPSGVSVVPPKTPVRTVTVPDPTAGRTAAGRDVGKDAESEPDDPDEAANDGLAGSPWPAPSRSWPL